jgi:hypothetical protein
MINLSEIIAGIVAKFLDALKTPRPRLWAILASFVIAAEQLLLSNVFPFTEKIPVMVTEIVVAIAAVLLNSASFEMASVAKSGTPAGGIGAWIEQQLALLIDKFKAGSLTAFTVFQIVFTGFKFYIISDPTLNLPETIVNLILSVIMLVLAPRTRPILAEIAAKKKSIK